MRPDVRGFPTAAVAGGGAGVMIGLTLWAHAALASASTPPTPVQLCANGAGIVVYAAGGTCPSNTTAIPPVAQQSGVADLYTRLNADEATISSLQGQVTTDTNNITTLQNQVTSLQSQVTTDTNNITALQSLVASLNLTTLQDQVTTDTNDITSLQGLLKGVSRAPDANGYDTLTFSGMNLQVVNGTGSESTTNGLGNLIVGYADNELGFGRTGSHNLITGDDGGWTSSGGLLAGTFNQVTGRWASVSGGFQNTASGDWASVSGGPNNTASGYAASVSGGGSNTASGGDASVSGGGSNTASLDFASVSGGAFNTASGRNASVSGGGSNTASGQQASVSGGALNVAGGNWDAILGGASNTIASTYSCAYFPGSPTTSNC